MLAPPIALLACPEQDCWSAQACTRQAQSAIDSASRLVWPEPEERTFSAGDFCCFWCFSPPGGPNRSGPISWPRPVPSRPQMRRSFWAIFAICRHDAVRSPLWGRGRREGEKEQEKNSPYHHPSLLAPTASQRGRGRYSTLWKMRIEHRN